MRLSVSIITIGVKTIFQLRMHITIFRGLENLVVAIIPIIIIMDKVIGKIINIPILIATLIIITAQMIILIGKTL